MDGPENLAGDRCGWASELPHFSSSSLDDIVNSLSAYVADATPEQIRAWRNSIPPLKARSTELLAIEPRSKQYGAILEYLMPESLRRADAVLLVSGAVLVIELKGDGNWRPEYIEQAADYARRLYWYHSLCGAENVRVHPILVSYGLKGEEVFEEWHTRTNIEALLEVVRRFDRPGDGMPIAVADFVAPRVCQPSLSLVQAARRFFSDHALPHIKRIDEITSSAVDCILREIRAASATQARTLILLSGVPGAGKTYVGLRIAHESFLDDLAEPMEGGGKPTAPAVFLSGNGPLVEVLQYELKRAGGGGRVFVRGVRDFVERYSKKNAPAPPHHVLIFDEAQRAWDAEKVRAHHDEPNATSEPESFIRFAERIPGWGVVLGLIGEGQEIHTGEESGIAQWADALANHEGWRVVCPARFLSHFAKRGISCVASDELHLATSVRFNFAAGLTDWAAGVVQDDPVQPALASIAAILKKSGYQIRITRRLGRAKEFLWEKYKGQPESRFGMLVSSRARGLAPYGVEQNRFFHAGPWYADPDISPSSCRRLQEPATEFAAQGLELDHVLLAWGDDFVMRGGSWDNSAAKKYRDKSVKDPKQLRRNAYRVLLTRGREGILIWVPDGLTALDETYEFLLAAGCDPLE
jgi:hypothetical protein